MTEFADMATQTTKSWKVLPGWGSEQQNSWKEFQKAGKHRPRTVQTLGLTAECDQMSSWGVWLKNQSGRIGVAKNTGPMNFHKHTLGQNGQKAHAR